MHKSQFLKCILEACDQILGDTHGPKARGPLGPDNIKDTLE